MRVEHVGFIVNAPVSMGRWYAEHLGWRMIKSSGDDQEGGAFLKDEESTIIEFTRPAGKDSVDYRTLDPLQAHLAIDCPDPFAFAEKLAKAGATVVEQTPRTPGATQIVMVRDPWGFSLQLINRSGRLD